MSVPSTIADLDAVASNNSPAGTDSIGTSLDDYLRAHAAIIKQVSNAKQDSLGVTPTAAGLALLDDADAAAQRTTLGLAIGTNVQAYMASASQVEMEAGTESALRAMSPLRVSQAITALGGRALTFGTAQTMTAAGLPSASPAGAYADFTDIPSWVKRITIMFNGVSTNGTDQYLLRTGSGSIDSSGYLSTVVGLFNTSSVTASGPTDGFGLSVSQAAGDTVTGHISLVNISGNSWVLSGSLLRVSGNVYTVTGSKTLSGTLDRIRVTTTGGTNVFDAGSVNILYE